MTRWIAWTFLRSAGWPRAALLAGTTAVATALVLVALTMLLLPSQPVEALFSLVAEPGLRWGTAFATTLLVLPLLLMLNQVVRLGTAKRERRLAALRLAGATPAEVRRIGAIEVGLPVTLGALTGPLVFVLLREVFGGTGIHPGYGGGALTQTLALIPRSVTPSWWQMVAVVAVVAAAGVATGSLASRHLVASPLGVSRRVGRPAPRPWGLLLVGTGLAAVAVAASGVFGRGQAAVMAGILLVVLGVVALGPWVAFRSGQRAARRTSDPATLIAAGHLVSDPRPAGRAAAAVGAIGIASGATAVMEVGVFFYSNSSFIDPFFVISFALVGAALILVLLVTASTLAVHAAESLVDRRRVLAALVAAGTPVSVLRDALRREAMLTAMPLSVGGVLIGAVVAGAVGVASADSTGTPMVNLAGLLVVSGQVALTVGLTCAAIRIAIGAVAPRLVQASAPANLRTE
ncbi:MAG: FtsX-like permease family protein [Dermatophilaceae bacterium]